MKKFVYPAAVVAVALGMAACGSKDSTASVPSDDVVETEYTEVDVVATPVGEAASTAATAVDGAASTAAAAVGEAASTAATAVDGAASTAAAAVSEAASTAAAAVTK